MSIASPYSIPFIGVKLGVHEFDFEIGDQFFVDFLGSPVEKCDLKIHLSLEKQEGLLQLTFDIEGTVNVPCHLCGQEFDMELLDQHNLLVKQEDARATEDIHDEEEIIYISRNETKLEIAQWIYEFIILSLPMQIVHPLNEKGEGTCDKAALTLIKNMAHKEESGTDPRWDALSK